MQIKYKLVLNASFTFCAEMHGYNFDEWDKIYVLCVRNAALIPLPKQVFFSKHDTQNSGMKNFKHAA